MERKDLTIYRVGWDSTTENYDELKMVDSLDWDAEVLLKSEADAVMDAQEAKIKELEDKLDSALQDVQEWKETSNQNHKAYVDYYKLTETLTSRIQELEANQPKWVSVKERMPLTIRPVLSSIYGSVMVDSWNGECWESNCHITHWMPLPTPPKETK